MFNIYSVVFNDKIVICPYINAVILLHNLPLYLKKVLYLNRKDIIHSRFEFRG